ncbi:MAG: hypothetical protein KDA80_14870 [Planctomycetaceae bacterium]|nr:hypothetical protein [Planctomycetaceae bacterium]
MSRRTFAYALASLLVLLMTVEAAQAATTGQVVNKSDAAVRVKVIHVTNPRIYWDVGVLQAGQASQFVPLDFGSRQVIVKSAFTERILKTEDFEVVDDGLGRLIEITGSAVNGTLTVTIKFPKKAPN